MLARISAKPCGLVVEVERQRRSLAALDAITVWMPTASEHAGGGRVDVGHHGRLHAIRQHEHLARMFARGPAPAPCGAAAALSASGGRPRTICPAFMAGQTRGRGADPLSAPSAGLFAHGAGTFHRRSCGQYRPGGRIARRWGRCFSPSCGRWNTGQVHLGLARGLGASAPC